MSNTSDSQNQQQTQDSLAPGAWQQQNQPPGGGVGGGTGTGLPSNYVPPPRYQMEQYTNVRAAESGGPKSKTKVSVAGVVSSKNVIQDYYVPTRDAATILSQMEDTTRLRLQQQMYAAGWYGSSTPQFVQAAKKGIGYLGLSDADKNAFGDLLLTANQQGVTWDVLLNSVSNVTRADLGIAGGSGRTKPSSADLTEIIQRTAVETIGRKLDDATAAQLVSNYQGVYASARGEQAPSADVFFKNRIEQKYGAESEATKYLTAISNLAQMLGGA